MPFQSVWVDPVMFMEHNGVRVFHTYIEDTFLHPSPTTFTLDPTDTDPDSPRAFDVMTLQVPSARNMAQVAPPPVEQRAQELGLTFSEYSETPDFYLLREQWAEWIVHGRQAFLREIVKEALDMGIIRP